MENNRHVAIVILNYNSWKETIKEANLCNRMMQIDYRNIIVIDNASPNDSAEMLEKESEEKHFVFIRADANQGYAAGNNIGLRYAFQNGYEYALILNNDIIIEDPGLILKLLDGFKKDSCVAVVNPDIYSPDKHLFNRDAVKPTFLDYTVGMLQYRKKGRKLTEKDGIGFVYRPQGCCMMVDLQKMDEVDYFDEHTFLYCEEPILAERLLKKGYLCACNTAVSIIHNHSETVKSTFDIKRIVRIQNDSFAYYLKEYRGYSIIAIKICCFFNALKLKYLNK